MAESRFKDLSKNLGIEASSPNSEAAILNAAKLQQLYDMIAKLVKTQDPATVKKLVSKDIDAYSANNRHVSRDDIVNMILLYGKRAADLKDINLEQSGSDLLRNTLSEYIDIPTSLIGPTGKTDAVGQISRNLITQGTPIVTGMTAPSLRMNPGGAVYNKLQQLPLGDNDLLAKTALVSTIAHEAKHPKDSLNSLKQSNFNYLKDNVRTDREPHSFLPTHFYSTSRQPYPMELSDTIDSYYSEINDPFNILVNPQTRSQFLEGTSTSRLSTSMAGTGIRSNEKAKIERILSEYLKSKNIPEGELLQNIFPDLAASNVGRANLLKRLYGLQQQYGASPEDLEKIQKYIEQFEPKPQLKIVEPPKPHPEIEAPKLPPEPKIPKVPSESDKSADILKQLDFETSAYRKLVRALDENYPAAKGKKSVAALLPPVAAIGNLSQQDSQEDKTPLDKIIETYNKMKEEAKSGDLNLPGADDIESVPNINAPAIRKATTEGVLKVFDTVDDVKSKVLVPVAEQLMAPFIDPNASDTEDDRRFKEETRQQQIDSATELLKLPLEIVNPTPF